MWDKGCSRLWARAHWGGGGGWDARLSPRYWEEGVLSYGSIMPANPSCVGHQRIVHKVRNGEESLTKQLEDSCVDRRGGELPGTRSGGSQHLYWKDLQCRCGGHQSYHPGGSPQLSVA